MGPIQSSLNQLTLGIAGAAAGLAKGLKSSGKKPEAKPVQQEPDKQEPVQTNYGPTALEGKQYDYTARLGSRPYNKYAAALAAQTSGNDLIRQKARSSFKTAEQRLADIRNQETNSINQNAINEFGITDDISKGIYMLPDGRMIDGTYKGETDFRSVEHNDISSAYESAGVEIPGKGGIDSMYDFMKRGNIRMLPETKTIDISSKPSSEQMNAIYKMFNQGNLESISISDGDKTIEFKQNIDKESEISDLIRKHFGGSK